MTEEKSASSTFTPSSHQASLRNGLILGLFAMVSTGLIAITHLITKDKIAEEIEHAMARRLNQVIPPEEYDNEVYRDCIKLDHLELLGSHDSLAYRVRKNQADRALFVTSVAPDGYGGKIKLLIGIYQNGRLAGVRVAEHQETPGLGDKIEIEKSDWIKQFDQQSFDQLPIEKWQVKKDGGHFDAFTGATITPRAIVKAVKNTLVYFEANQAKLFSAPSDCGTTK